MDPKLPQFIKFRNSDSHSLCSQVHYPQVDELKPTVTELFRVLRRFIKSNDCTKFLSGRVRAYVGI